MKISQFLPCSLGLALSTGAFAQKAPALPPPGDIPLAEYARRTVVVYNTLVPESVKLANYYAEQRKIPAENLIGLELDKQETIDRIAFNTTIAEPLRKKFTENQWWVVQDTPQGKMSVKTEKRIFALMTGVPLRITQQEIKVKNPDTGKMEAEAAPAGMENSSSVDSELMAFGLLDHKIQGPLNNLYANKDALFLSQALAPIYLVGRIDGPSYKDCQRLIDDAIATEKIGLFGHAYIDLAQKNSPGYKQGEDWLINSAKTWSDAGFPTNIDLQAGTYPENYPMRNAAIYLGWYTLPADGPFLNPAFRFKRGAVACHIHSFSATSVRNPKEGYVAPFVVAGAAAVPGNVWEPYLGATIALDVLSDRLLKGYTVAEASSMATPVMSWMNVMIGDPLYRPFIANTKTAQSDQPYASLRRWLKMHAASGEKDRNGLVEKLAQAAEAEKSPLFYEAAALYAMGVLKDDDKKIAGWLTAAAEATVVPAESLRLNLVLADYYLATSQQKKAKKLLEQLRTSYAKLVEIKAVEAKLKTLE